MASLATHRLAYDSAHHKLYKLLVWAAATSLEARCSALLDEAGLPFVRGYEGGRVDCGLLSSIDSAKMPSDTSEQLFKMVPSLAAKKLLLAMDFKLLVNKLRPRSDGGLYSHSFYMTADEAACAAFIVQNPEFPNEYALIPAAYIKKRNGGSIGDSTFYGREIPLTSRPLEPFPLEWTPFVMSADTLSLSLESLLEFSQNDVPWRNFELDLPFAVPSKPVLQRVDYLLSTSARSDFESIRQMWSIFEEHGQDFKMQRLAIQPGHSDFFFVHKSSGQKIAVELKRNILATPREDLFVWTNSSEFITTPFYASASWDYLLMNYQPDRDLFCFISRSAFPAHFFDGSTAGDRTQTWRPEDPEFLRKQMVRWSSDEAFVSGIESILSLDSEHGSLISDKTVPISFLADNDLSLDRDIENRRQGEFEAQIDVEEGYVRGSGRRWSRMLWEASYEELLLKQLDRTGNGSLYRLGIHTCGTYVFAPYTPPGLTFHELHPKTPLIYINLATVVTDDRWIPSDGRRPLPFLPATHGPHASIYLIADRRPGMEGEVARQMYVIRSSLLNTEERYDYHEDVLSTMVQGATRNHKLVRLTSGQHLGRFVVPFSRVMERVSTMVQECNNTQDNLLTNKAAVVAEFLSMFNGQAYWQQRNIADEDFLGLVEAEAL